MSRTRIPHLGAKSRRTPSQRGQLMRRGLADEKLTPAELRVLFALMLAGAPDALIGLRDLATMTGLSSSGVRKAAQGLERKGYIRIEQRGANRALRHHLNLCTPGVHTLKTQTVHSDPQTVHSWSAPNKYPTDTEQERRDVNGRGRGFSASDGSDTGARRDDRGNGSGRQRFYASLWPVIMEECRPSIGEAIDRLSFDRVAGGTVYLSASTQAQSELINSTHAGALRECWQRRVPSMSITKVRAIFVP